MGRELYIEQEDFAEVPPPKFHRLYPGNEVRLRAGYIIKCTGVEKDAATGQITEIRCTYDPQTKSGMPEANRKVKGTIHWVSAAHAIDAEVRLYDHLFAKADPSDVPKGGSYLDNLNPNSLEVLPNAKLEPSLATAQPGDRFQFERNGYFCVDIDSTATKLIFNRTVTLRDTWAKIDKRT
jgi:glutaminyl-tRNA synthetase